MKKVLIITLGNSDIQIKKEEFNKLKKEYQSIFIPNKNDNDYMLINSQKFRDYTKIILENYLDFEKFINFKIIDSLLNYLKNEKFQKIIFFVSNQNYNEVGPLNFQKDTIYEGLILIKYLKNKNNLDSEIKEINLNLSNLKNLISFFSPFFQELNKYFNEIFIEGTGGVPNYKTALFLSTIFLENIKFLEVNNDLKILENNYKTQKNLILKDKIESMLKVYDFEGIRNLPIDIKIKNICKEANDRYNFNIVEINSNFNYGEKAKEAIIILYSNLIVLYKQKKYIDIIHRIFRIEECIWYFLLFKFLLKKDLINDEDKIKRINSDNEEKFDTKFEKLISQLNNFFPKFYLYHFKWIFVEDENKKYKFKSNNLKINIGKNFYYYFFKDLNLYSNVLNFFEKINLDKNNNIYSNKSKLNVLRNNSIAGHGFRKVELKDIEEICGEFDFFLKNLKNLIENEIINEKMNNIFDNYVNEINGKL